MIRLNLFGNDIQAEVDFMVLEKEAEDALVFLKAFVSALFTDKEKGK